MDVLAHADVGPLIHAALGVTGTATLARVCHATHLRVRAQLAAWQEQLRAARPHGVTSSDARVTLAGRGHLQVLQWMLRPGIFNGSPIQKDGRLCLAAVRGGHLEVLQWLRSAGAPWDAGTAVAAAGQGHLDVLKWMHANGCPQDSTVVTVAARLGRLSMIRWLHSVEWPWTNGACFEAARNGQLETLQWFLANGGFGGVFPANVCNLVVHHAAQGGHLKVLVWLRETGCDWNAWIRSYGQVWSMCACTAAACHGHLCVLQWLREHGCPWSKADCEVAARESGRHAVLAWIRAQPE